MSKIKTREVIKGGIKVLNKGATALDKTKNNLVNIKEKSENAYNNYLYNDSNDYASQKVEKATDNLANKGIRQLERTGRKNVFQGKENIKTIKSKINEFKNKRQLNKTKKTIKTAKNTIKNTKKVVKETAKTIERAKKLAISTVKKTVHGIKAVAHGIKVTVTTIKNIIAGIKALISLIIAGGWIAIVIIIVICLVGMLCNSVFGIFFSNEKVDENSILMKDVVAECNQDFSNRIQIIQNENYHEDYVLNGEMASWKDVLIVYTIKEGDGVSNTDVATIDNLKKDKIKEIFWKMNSLSFEVKDEMVIEKGININEAPKEVLKKVLHININHKKLDDMIVEYNFNSLQKLQIKEISSPEYSSLWNGIIYGLNETGDFLSWRQNDAKWGNVRIGNTNRTLSEIGCLVTSIAILIEKSGVETTISPFNPGSFVEELNKKGGFDSGGNLQYTPISKIAPNFKYEGNINLRGKTKEEKFSLIKKYFDNGYYLTVEVKGATPGNQHWVAVIDINASDIIIVDPSSNQNNLWNAYEFSKTSQFSYFKVS